MPPGSSSSSLRPAEREGEREGGTDGRREARRERGEDSERKKSLRDCITDSSGCVNRHTQRLRATAVAMALHGRLGAASVLCSPCLLVVSSSS